MLLQNLKNISRVRTCIHRHVSSLPPLTAAFNTKQSVQFKFNWLQSKTGTFGLPELKRSDGWEELRDRCFVNCDHLVKEVTSSERKRNVAVIFDDLSDELCRVADMAEFVRLAHPDEATSLAAQDACISISGLVEQLNTHTGIFFKLQEAVNQGDINSESEVDKHVAKLFLQDFLQCGIHLPDADREKVVDLNDAILRLGQQFAAGCHLPRVIKSEVLPSNVRQLFKVESNGTIVMTGQHFDSPSDLARQAAYKVYYLPDSNQETLLSSMLESRHNLATLCGYRTFSDRAVTHSLAQSPENIEMFLSSLGDLLKSRLDVEYEVMKDMKRKNNPSGTQLSVWDVPFLSSLAKHNWFSLDLETVSQYFSLGVAMEGLNELFQNLYGVELVVETPEEGELWSGDVCKLAVRDSTQLLGHIYCDFFRRPSKPLQDCHFTIRGGRVKADGEYQDPVVVLMLNLNPPTRSSPTLLSPGALDNLFHEMGHAMHSMLGRTKYQHVTGTRCSTDFAEVPSTLMEYFAADPRVLTRINKHYKTGEKLPESVISKLCDTKKVFSAVDLQAQLFYSSMDQVLHGDHPLPGDMTTCIQEVQTRCHSLPGVPHAAYHHRFSHLVGYGARYYSYMMARSVASAIWQKSFQEDPFSRDAGLRYRQECLSHGGGKPSHQMVSDYLQSQLSPQQLAAALIQEVDIKQHHIERSLKNAKN